MSSLSLIFQSGRSFFDREVVFIGTNGRRPAIGGGNNDNFFHGESRVIRSDKDDDKDNSKDDDDDDVNDNDYMMIITVIANSDRQSRMHRELTMSTHVDKSGENGKKEIQTCREICISH